MKKEAVHPARISLFKVLSMIIKYVTFQSVYVLGRRLLWDERF
jgi:hypothetical protein